MEKEWRMCIVCKHGSMKGEMRERGVQESKVVGFLVCIIKGRRVSMEMKKGVRDGIFELTITYASEIWM